MTRTPPLTVDPRTERQRKRGASPGAAWWLTRGARNKDERDYLEALRFAYAMPFEKALAELIAGRTVTAISFDGAYDELGKYRACRQLAIDFGLVADRPLPALAPEFRAEHSPMPGNPGEEYREALAGAAAAGDGAAMLKTFGEWYAAHAKFLEGVRRRPGPSSLARVAGTRRGARAGVRRHAFGAPAARERRHVTTRIDRGYLDPGWAPLVDRGEEICMRSTWGALRHKSREERRRMLAVATFEYLRHDRDGAYAAEPVPA